MPAPQVDLAKGPASPEPTSELYDIVNRVSRLEKQMMLVNAIEEMLNGTTKLRRRCGVAKNANAHHESIIK